MFHGWGFVLSEIWVLLAFAALIGLLIGWLIWGRKTEVARDTAEADRLRADLASCHAKGRDQAARLTSLEGEVAQAQAAAATAKTEVARAESAAPTVVVKSVSTPAPASLAPSATAASQVSPSAATAPKTADPKSAAAKPAAKVASAKAAAKPADSGPAKPKTLTAPRGGKADDLKRIKGVRPKMEALLNRLGFFHFDQVSSWTAREIAWVDENLEDFKGRATREEWVAQARDLAAGKPSRLAAKS